MIEFRDLDASNIREVAEISSDTFSDKYESMLGSYSQENKAFLIDILSFFAVEKDTYCILAYQGDELLGLIRLKGKNLLEQENTIESNMSFGKLCNKYGIWKIFKFIAICLLLDHSVKKNECYITEIAVSEKARGKGVGTKLLAAGEEFARKNGKSIYSLYVADSNQAKNLYERTGFTVIKKESSRLMKYFFGRKDWLYMEKRLP